MYHVDFMRKVHELKKYIYFDINNFVCELHHNTNSNTYSYLRLRLCRSLTLRTTNVYRICGP